MSSETTSAAPAAREHFWVWRLIIGFFAGIWRLIHGVLIYIVLLGIGVSLAASWLTSQENADPSTWRVSQYLSSLGQNLLVAAGVFGLLAFVAFVAWRADTTKQMWEQDARTEMERIRTEEQRQRIVEDVESGATKAISKREGSIALDAYSPIQMSTLKPRDCGVDFVDSAYQGRDADSQAHEILRAVANHAGGSESIIGENLVGICIVGQHNSGKSRLVWEALSHHLPELQAWRFLPWPLSEDRQFPIELMKGQRVVVLVDRLEKYAAAADPRVSRRLNRLSQQFADAKIPLIVIATHRGADRKVAEELDSLLASLETIELPPISPEQAEKLEADLQRRGMRAHTFDETTPGSIVEGRATEADYEHLSGDAQQVMKVLRLFASVGISNGDVYVTKDRVCAVANALFDMPHLRWRSATDELIAKDLVEGRLVAPSYERVISAISDDVLDIVSDYPLGGKDIMEVEDWPLLHEVFQDRRDAEALVALGVAWKDSRLPLLDLGAPSNLDNLVRAADCFRTALEIQYQGDKEANPSAWALVELYLAEALTDQHLYMQTMAQSPTRLEALQESATAYQAALEHFTLNDDPETWVSVTSSLAFTLSEQAKFVDDAAKTAKLDEARRLGESALGATGTQTSPDITRAVKTVLANISLDCAQVAATAEEAVKWEAEAYEFASSALRVLQDSDPETVDSETLAFARTTLGRIMRFQASLTTGEARANMLKQVEALLHEGLNALPEASVETVQAQMWTRSVLAETLLQHARMAASTIETQERLTESEQLCRDVMGTVAAQRDAEALAWIQGVYAGVLAQQAASAEKAQQEAVLSEAWENCAVALDMPNQESAPEDWAGTRFIAAALALQIARFLGEQQDDEACSTLDQARQYLTDALGVYTRPAYFDEQQQALALHEEIKQSAKELGCSV